MNADGPIRCFTELKKDKFNEEKVKTTTSKDQIATEKLIEKCFDRFEHLVYLDEELPTIHRKDHIRYIESSLQQLSQNYECLDSSRPWLVYWILNAAHLLSHELNDYLLDNVVDFLIKCRSPSGGFGGGPGQHAHLAPTYAAVNALCIIGTERALHTIDRKSLRNFLWSVRDANGAFRMHVDGETDIRGVYCAITAAKLANFSLDDERKLFENTVEWIVSCQTYEGGIGGAPDLEAHGGYTFCGIAALTLLGSTGNCNLKALLRWAVNRQMRFEGGFQGRTNKLVDGCYSFWQGAILPIVQALINKNEPEHRDIMKRPLFNRGALQEYILICCQIPSGGLIDKPGKPPDLYHTCYTLSGLSIAQHCEVDMSPLVIGNADNEVLPTHPLYNVPPKAVWKSYYHFKENYTDLYNEKSKHWSDRSASDTTDERSFNRCSTSGSQMSGADDANDDDDVVRKDDDSMITDDDGISVSTSSTT